MQAVFGVYTNMIQKGLQNKGKNESKQKNKNKILPDTADISKQV